MSIGVGSASRAYWSTTPCRNRNNLYCGSDRSLIRGSRNRMSRSSWRWTTAAGWARAEARYGQSGGQAISTSRLVPQQTGQMSRPMPGQARFAFRVAQMGQSAFMLKYVYNRTIPTDEVAGGKNASSRVLQRARRVSAFAPATARE